MDTKDEYLVYTSHNNDTFYFKNRKLHREDGPAIISHKDKSKGTFDGLKDRVLYTRVSEPVEPNEQNDEILFESYHLSSEYFLEGVRFKSKQEMYASIINNELNEKTERVLSKKTKI
jgi:vacuolar-type H+-ATPase subunit I/STV1